MLGFEKRNAKQFFALLNFVKKCHSEAQHPRTPTTPPTTMAEGIYFSVGKSRSLCAATHLCVSGIFECHIFARFWALIGVVEQRVGQ